MKVKKSETFKTTFKFNKEIDVCNLKDSIVNIHIYYKPL